MKIKQNKENIDKENKDLMKITIEQKAILSGKIPDKISREIPDKL